MRDFPGDGAQSMGNFPQGCDFTQMEEEHGNQLVAAAQSFTVFVALVGANDAAELPSIDNKRYDL
jgi:hypothetical protein